MNPRMFRLALVAAALLSPALARADASFGLFLPGENAPIPLPLAGTKVSGTLRGFVAEVEVTQIYVNPYDQTIEATYVFPLPERAAVHRMTMHVASRVIEAEIKPREDAEKIYEEAKAAGHTASLLTQERPNITSLALAHSLVSAYTAFVAVDRDAVVRQPTEPLIPVHQRLPLPEGVSRRALAELSRHEIPPGDPVIEVGAPSDARRVTATFPFGLVKELVYDPQRSIWRGRFLVPEGIPDGHYTVLVVIELIDGTTIERREPYVLDSKAEDFEVELVPKPARAGKMVSVQVDSVEAAEEVYVHCLELGWLRHTLSAKDRVHWSARVRVPADAGPGEYAVLVAVRDRAGNRTEQRQTLTVEAK